MRFLFSGFIGFYRLYRNVLLFLEVLWCFFFREIIGFKNFYLWFRIIVNRMVVNGWNILICILVRL